MGTEVDTVVVLAEMTMDIGDLQGDHLLEEEEEEEEEGVITLRDGEDQEERGQGQSHILLMEAQKGAMGTELGEVLWVVALWVMG